MSYCRVDWHRRERRGRHHTVLLTRYFGLGAFSTLYGLTWTFYAAAGAIGPVILGRAFDMTGSYATLLMTLAVALGLAAAANLLLPLYSDSTATLWRLKTTRGRLLF